MASEPRDDDPDYTLIIVGDDDKYYKLTYGQWKNAATELTPAEKGVVEQLAHWGSYLSFIPSNEFLPIGSVCTVVNLKSILKNKKPTDSGGEPKE
ncbi:MAG TPA: hypothetical protein VKY73_02555 [Polyangiaceae bacterium]|nr:hypothetical protein [Polyangiaceae bacterium]